MRHYKSDDASSTHEQFGLAGFRSPADQSHSSLLGPGVGAGAGGSMSSFGGGAGYYGRGSVSEASEVSTYSAAGVSSPCVARNIVELSIPVSLCPSLGWCGKIARRLLYAACCTLRVRVVPGEEVREDLAA